jgi:hypothetical protein
MLQRLRLTARHRLTQDWPQGIKSAGFERLWVHEFFAAWQRCKSGTRRGQQG